MLKNQQPEAHGLPLRGYSDPRFQRHDSQVNVPVWNVSVKQFHGAGIMIGGTAGKPAASLCVLEADSSVVFSRPLSPPPNSPDGQQQIFLRPDSRHHL